MSDTPRTDMFCRTVDHTALVGSKIYQATIETVDASFARQLEKELAEAQTEVKRLALEIENKQYTITCASEENQQLKESLAEARAEIDKLNAEIERLKGVVISQITPEPLVLSKYSTTAEPTKDERDKLIEQMRRALAVACLYEMSSAHMETIDAALSAADGGE